MLQKEEIIKTLQLQSTILSFPERGTCGDCKYPGNWSPYIPWFFWWKLGARSTAECFAGSGTTSDAAKIWKIPYYGIDLNPSPVREDIESFDILDMNHELPDPFRYSDVILAHDPYPGINYIKYAGHAWTDPDGKYKKLDIQNMNYEDGMKALDKAHMRLYSSMAAGSFLVIMVGELRSNNQYHSMYKDMAIPGELFQTYVKIQHNTRSEFKNRDYGKSQRSLTGQEMIAVIKKPSGYEIAYVMPTKYAMDIRNSKSCSWADVVMTYAREEKTFTNQQIISDLKEHEKGRNNHHVAEKIRQTCARLASKGLLKHQSSGRWSLSA